MKKVAVLLAALLSLILSQVGQAADLQAGWYASIYTVDIYTYNVYGQPSLRAGAYFYQTLPGDYGPFHVSGGNPSRDYQRFITIPNTVQNIGPDSSLALPFSIPLDQGQAIAYISFAWQTNYNANQMYIDFWRTHADGTIEQIWSQRQGGLQFDTTHIAFNTTLDGPYYFKVNVVPEPSSLLPLLVGIFDLLALKRKK